MLSPKRVKYRKPHLTALRGTAKGANKVDFGEYGLLALENGWITARQIEAVRVAISRKMKKGGKIWIRIFWGASPFRFICSDFQMLRVCLILPEPC